MVDNGTTGTVTVETKGLEILRVLDPEVTGILEVVDREAPRLWFVDIVASRISVEPTRSGFVDRFVLDNLRVVDPWVIGSLRVVDREAPRSCFVDMAAP